MHHEDPLQLDVIAVGAHPDDVEIGCGGLLARLVEQGRRVGIIDLTDGEPTPGSPGPDVRLAEATEAARLLGVGMRVTLPLPNRRLFDSHEGRIALAKVFRQYRPRLVLGLHGATPMASPDHAQARALTDAGVFYSRLTKWDDQFDGLPPHRVAHQLYYSLAMHDPSVAGASGAMVVDMGGNLQKKLAAIRAYRTQFPPEKQGIFARVEAMARYFGDAAGFEHGELLLSPRAIGVRDLIAHLDG